MCIGLLNQHREYAAQTRGLKGRWTTRKEVTPNEANQTAQNAPGSTPAGKAYNTALPFAVTVQMAYLGAALGLQARKTAVRKCRQICSAKWVAAIPASWT